MATLLRISTETLPRVLVLDPPVTDAEFETLCRENDNVRLERTKEGAVRMNPPTGGWTGSGNQEIARQLGNWSVDKGRGRVFDSSTGFRLPDGSTLSPDASYVSEERLHSLPKGALRGFPRICPDFVIELRSESDALQDLKDKMNDWIANGAQLGWLIDPYERQVLIYHTDHATEVVTGNQIAGDGPVEGLVVDLAESGSATKTENTLFIWATLTGAHGTLVISSRHPEFAIEAWQSKLSCGRLGSNAVKAYVLQRMNTLDGTYCSGVSLR